MADAPRILHAAIGGFPGPSYSIEWTGSELIYEAHSAGERTAWVKHQPTEADWARFWRRCSRAGIWLWRRSYESGALDGTSWHIDIESESGSLHSSGDQAFPPDGGTDETKEFKAFCKALSELAGGTPFN